MFLSVVSDLAIKHSYKYKGVFKSVNNIVVASYM